MTDRRIPRRHLVVALLALLAGGCSASSAGEVRDQGAARSGPPLSVPARTVESGSAGLEDRVAPDAQPAAAALYLVRFGRIEAVARPLGGDGRGRAGLDALLDGPTAAERSLEYRTAIPRGTEVNAFSVDGDTATVDLSADFATSDGTDGFDQERVFALAQVVYTVTDADAVTRVRLLVNGEPAGSALGSGLVDRPLDREFIGILLAQALDAAPRTTCVPAREVDESPPQAEPIVLGRVRMQGDRLIVRGRLGGGEARTFVTRVLHDGNELRHEIATGCSGTFRQELPVPVGVTGELVIEAYVPQRTGARDGLVRKRFVIPEE